MKKYFKWAVVSIASVAIAMAIVLVVRFVFPGNVNEQKAIALGFHRLPNITGNPVAGIEIEREPRISTVASDSYKLIPALIRGEPGVLDICDNLVTNHFTPEDQIDRLSTDTAYIFPDQIFSDDDPYFSSKLNILSLGRNLTFRAIVKAVNRDFHSALGDIRRVHQVADNLRKSPHLNAHDTAEGGITSYALRYLSIFATQSKHDAETRQFVKDALDIFSARPNPPYMEMLNWQANSQLAFLQSDYFRKFNENENRLGPIAVPIPVGQIKERIFSQYIANVNAFKAAPADWRSQWTALTAQEQVNSGTVTGGILWFAESYILQSNHFEFNSASQSQILTLRAYLEVLAFEAKYSRLPEPNEIEMPFDPYKGFANQYVLVSVSGVKRPRVIIVSSDSATPFVYRGQYISRSSGVVEPDPLAKREREYFRPNGTHIMTHDPDHPDKKAPAFGPGTPAPPSMVR